MKQNVQLEPPALLGRRERINGFRQFVETNRKELSASKLVARYALESGIRTKTIEGYLKLLYEAGVYAKPRYVNDFMLLTPEEDKKAIKEYERKREIERKQRQEHEEANLYSAF